MAPVVAPAAVPSSSSPTAWQINFDPSTGSVVVSAVAARAGGSQVDSLTTDDLFAPADEDVFFNEF